MTVSASPDSFELSDYLGVLRRKWLTIVAFTLLGTLAAVAYVVVAPKVYTATSSVYVTANAANTTALLNSKSSIVINMDNEAQIVTSTSVASLAAATLHKELGSTFSPAALAQNVSVTVPANTQILQIGCTASGARKAADCAEAFANAYMSARQATAQARVQTETQAAQGKATPLANQVVKLEIKINSYRTGSSQIVAARANLADLKSRLAPLQAAIAALSASNNYQPGYIITPATAPGSPSSPRKLLYGPSGLTAGLLIGLIVAFLRDRRDGRIHAAADVERHLGLPVLLGLDRRPPGLQSTLVPPRSPVGRSFAELASEVSAMLGDGNHVLLVTGTSRGPDSSVLAANLAATLARTRSDVVLICADQESSISPQLTRVGSGGPGLAELIGGAATIGGVARPCADAPRLRVITPGVDSGAVADLQHDVCRQMIAALHRDARYVVVDAGLPASGGAGLSLAEVADAAIVVVQVGATTRGAIRDCVRWLDRIRIEVLGAVVLPGLTRPSRADRLAAADQERRPASQGPRQSGSAEPGRRQTAGADRQAEPVRTGTFVQEPPLPPSFQQEYTRSAGSGKAASDLPAPVARAAGQTWPLPRVSVQDPEERRTARPPTEFPAGETTEKS